MLVTETAGECPVNYCTNGICRPATVTPELGLFYCVCPNGFSGVFCENSDGSGMYSQLSQL